MANRRRVKGVRARVVAAKRAARRDERQQWAKYACAANELAHVEQETSRALVRFAKVAELTSRLEGRKVPTKYTIPPHNPKDDEKDWLSPSAIPSRRHSLGGIPPELWGEIPLDRQNRWIKDFHTSFNDFHKDLERSENSIRRGQLGFVEAGRELEHIHRQRKWRTYYNSFRDYCHNAWQISVCHAYRLMRAAEIVDAIYDQCSLTCAALPSHEVQIRPLTRVRKPDGKLDIPTIIAIWQQAQNAPRNRQNVPIITLFEIRVAMHVVMGDASPELPGSIRREMSRTLRIPVNYPDKAAKLIINEMRFDQVKEIARTLIKFVRHIHEKCRHFHHHGGPVRNMVRRQLAGLPACYSEEWLASGGPPPGWTPDQYVSKSGGRILNLPTSKPDETSQDGDAGPPGDT